MRNPQRQVPQAACLPTPESGRGGVQTTRPGDEVLHTSGSQQRATGGEALHAYVFRIGDNPSLAQPRRLRRYGLQSNRADASDSSQGAPALLLALRFVEIGDTF